jgi:hypothetical protein
LETKSALSLEWYFFKVFNKGSSSGLSDFQPVILANLLRVTGASDIVDASQEFLQLLAL